MAVTIITPGVKERDTYIRTCPECKAKFSYQYSDTVDYSWNGGYRAIMCPECGYPVVHTLGGASEDVNNPRKEM